MNTIAFFNNKGGVGKTSLVYHLCWMYAAQGLKVLAADLDPQANLTSMFLDEETLEGLWPDGEHPSTVFGCLRPIMKGTGDLNPPTPRPIRSSETLFDGGVSLLVGDLGLSAFEDRLSSSWPLCADRDESAFRITSVFHRMMELASAALDADLVLVDVGPNLGAINRAALIAARHVVIPLAPDLFSMQGLRNLGPTLRRWRMEWSERLEKNPARDLVLPQGTMSPAGYVFMQHFAKDGRPVKAFDRWMRRIPDAYRSNVLGQEESIEQGVDDDPNCLARLKHYRSLMPMAMEARKPMFLLKPADGAIGAHSYAVRDCAQDFRHLAGRIAKACGVTSGRAPEGIEA